MKLAIAQMVLGALILCPYVLGGIAYLGRFMLPSPGIFGKIAFPLLGLAVLGCGIAQYLKARG